MKKLYAILSILFFLDSSFAQNVGINTPTPNTALDINGDMALRIANISLNAGINNNVNTSTTKRSTYRLIDATAAFTITGLDGGADGRVITLVNTTTYVLTLMHESANSNGANRFTLSNGVSYDVQPKATITLQYSVLESRWFLTGNSNLEKNAWGIKGNSGTDATVNFIGTTDNVPLSFRQNSKWVGRLNSTDRTYAIGGGAAETLLAGTTDNIAIGDSAMNGLTNTQNLIAIGSKTARNPFGNNNSIAIGTEAGRFGMSTNSVAIGFQSQKGFAPGGGGSFNTSVGAGSLSVNSATSNTAIGYNDLKNNTATENTGLGYKAMENHTTGDFNVAIGSIAMQSHKTGQENTVIGSNAMTNDTLGTANVAVGFGALNLKNNRSGIVAIGHSALRTNGNTATLPTEAIENTAVGYQSLQANNKGSNNTAVGSNSMASTSNGNDNTAVGKRALNANSNGNANTALGSDALTANGNNNNNTGIGYQSLYNNNGSNNTALGYQSLYNPSKGSSNVAIGTSALFNNIDKSNIVAIGDSALYNNGNGLTNATQGIQNTAIGSKALYANITGSQNTVLGYNGLINNTNGKSNIAIGVQTLGINVTGNNNVAIGDSAAYNTTVGNNVAIGKNSLFTNTIGNNNVGIGYNANVGSNNLTNATAIGANTTVNTSNSLILGNNAKVGIGISSPVASLDVNKIAGSTSTATFRGTNNITEFNTGANEDISIQPGKSGGQVFVNTNANSTTVIGSGVTGKVGINTNTPQAALDVLGDVHLTTAGSVGGGIYTDNTLSNLTPGLGLNIVPIGVVKFFGSSVSSTGGFINVAGNLCVHTSYEQDLLAISTQKEFISVWFDPVITNQYAQIIAIGSPGYVTSTTNIFNYYLMSLRGQINIGNYLGTPHVRYQVLVETDGTIPHDGDTEGTIIVYGIK